MNKEQLSYIAYGFQVSESDVISFDGFVMIPFENSFPDDWCFDEWKVDQVAIGDSLWWVVKIKGGK